MTTKKINKVSHKNKSRKRTIGRISRNIKNLNKDNKDNNNVRIITYNSSGLLMDAEIYKNIFIQNGFSVEIYKIAQNTNKNDIEKYCHINVILEVIPSDFKITFPSKYNLYMPNIELFMYFDELSNIDVVLCKTKVTENFMEHLKNIYPDKYKFKTVYTKFSTPISKEITSAFEKDVKKDNNLFIHLAGKSPFKNTLFVVECWIKNNGFVKYNPKIRLAITCYYGCFNKIKTTLFSMLNKKHIKHHKSYIKYHNMTFYTSPADINTYNNLLLEAGTCICISKKEGYGHYINEARYLQKCIITLDAEPMNELVIHNINGLLLKDKSKFEQLKFDEHNFPLYNAFPSIDELAKKIIYCIKNPDIINKMGIKGNKMYISDTNYLQTSMENVIANL